MPLASKTLWRLPQNSVTQPFNPPGRGFLGATCFLNLCAYWNCKFSKCKGKENFTYSSEEGFGPDDLRGSSNTNCFINLCSKNIFLFCIYLFLIRVYTLFSCFEYHLFFFQLLSSVFPSLHKTLKNLCVCAHTYRDLLWKLSKLCSLGFFVKNGILTICTVRWPAGPAWLPC